MRYLGLLFACLFAVNVGAFANTYETTAVALGVDDAEKIKIIATLENDLTILDSEILKCEKSKKGWIAATVVGSAGVVATGIAAGVQGAQIADKKQELAGHNAEISQKNQQLQTLQGQIK